MSNSPESSDFSASSIGSAAAASCGSTASFTAAGDGSCSASKACKVFDVGTGSGILAITASKLGAKEIQAADYDNVAVKVAKENIAKNHETANIAIFQSDLLQNMTGKADFIIANIIADIIIRMFKQGVDDRLNPNGAILTSGIIADRIGDVTTVAQECGFVVEKMQEKAGWAAIIFRRKEDIK